MPFEAGSVIGSYEVLAKLGAGGMGEVYRARDARLGRDVALKVLPPDVTGEAGRLERFDREARAIAALNHPHIVTIYSTEEADGIRFLTMELVEGRTLGECISGTGLPLGRFFDIALPLADALSAAHQKNITHRDLKPGNVMVTNDGRVKVLDFGLARIETAGAPEFSLAATQAPITHQGMLVGTMPYMSPEQVEGRTPDPRSDLFSLGVIFYELLTGERPFMAGSSPALMSAILRDTPQGIIDRRGDVPEAIERLVFRLLEKRPDDRVQTARDVFNELRYVKAQVEPSGARQSSVVRQQAVRPGTAPRTLPRVAVLPFAVRGADADAEAMATALTEDIATSLARFPGLSVVSAQSTRAFRGSSDDIRHIADQISARYVVSGHVRKSGTSVRVSAQLIDAAGGTQLWSENYDRTIDSGDIFAVQDDVTDHIVATVADPYGVLAKSLVQAVQAHGTLSEATSSELLVRTWGFQHQPVAETHQRLRAALESAVDAEPANAHLWAELSNMYVVEHSLWCNPQPDPLGRALQAARRAIEVDRNHQNGWLWQAITHFFLRDRDAFEDAGQRAIRINPRNAYVMAWIGNILTHGGEYDRGCALTERAMAINPAHPGWLHFAVFNRHFAAGEYEKALQAARRSNQPQFFWMHFAIAAACGRLDAAREGREAAARMVQLAPFLDDAANRREFVTRWYWPEELIESILEGLDRARNFDASAAAPLSSRAARPATRPPSATSAPRPAAGAFTVAVLPFVARSSDEDSKALAEGLTDDITSNLSKFGYLRVLSRSVVERLADGQADLRAQARYAIEGHVRRSGSTIRTTLTLVDTETGTNLWTHAYDRDAAGGVFAMQDAIAQAAAATIGDQTGALVRAMAASIAGRPVDQLTAAELAIRYHLYTESFHPEEHARLRDALERQLEREPRVAEGWACLALLYQHEHAFGLNPRTDPLGRQRRAAERGVEVDPTSQQAWVAMTGVHCFDRDREALRTAAERAVRLNPLNADLLAMISIYLTVSGDNDRAVALVRQAIDLKPQHPGWYHFPIFNDLFVRREYAAALAVIKAVNMPRMPLAHFDAAAAAGHLGQRVDAVAALAALRAIDPILASVDAARTVWSAWIWNTAGVETLIEGFNKALALERSPDSTSSAVAGLSATPAGASIAVLPFTDLSPTQDQQWFCDGIAEEILNALSPLPGLRVVARASAFSFRDSTRDLRSIGETLNVTTVLEGSVRRAGDRVRITAQLSEPRTDRQLWSERFDRELVDIFDVQDEIARAIVDKLRITLSSENARLVTKATSSIEAYELLLKGRVLLNRRGPAIIEAMQCFERAIAIDPKLSEAHALLGDAYRVKGMYGLAPPADTMPLARAAAERALALDATQVEAWATLAAIAMMYDWDYDAWQTASQRALTIDPSHVRSLAERAIALCIIATPAPSVVGATLNYIAQARTLDPLSPLVMALEALCLVSVGRTRDAVTAAERAVATDANNIAAQWALVGCLAKDGRDEEVKQLALSSALPMSGRNPRVLAELAAIHSRLGERDAAVAISQELERRAHDTYVGYAERAAVAASAGQPLEARALIEQAIAARDGYLMFWKHAAWQPFWNDPGCADALRNTALLRIAI